MADNRGNPSGSNSNLTMPNGVTRPTSNNHENDFDKLNYETLKQMSIANAKVMKILQDITKSKSIKGFEETINKLSNDIIKTHKTVGEQINKLNKEELEFKKKFTKEIQEREKQKGNIINVTQAFKLATESEEFKAMKLHYKNEMEKLEKTTKDEAKNSRKELIKRTFKLDTENKTIKFLDSKFAKNNNLKSTSNEYFSELEKLKSSSLETYGEDFEKTKGYKQALMNLNDKYSKDLKDAWKEDFKENHKVLSGISSGIKETFDKNKESLQGLLGPLNLFLSPMKDFFGGFGLVFKGIKGGMKGLFGKFTNKNPTVNDVLKSGAFGVGALFIGHKLDELLGKGKNSKEDKLKGLKGLFNKNVAGSMGTMTKSMSGAIGAIGIGLVWMAVDAIRGIFKAKEWGTSKVGAGLGGALGGMDSGIKGAFKNMGKWALLGAGIGSVVPVVGTIAGGVVGGAIGMILGAIGGKNLAKGFDAIGKWFKNIFFTSLIEVFDDMFSISKFKEIFKGEGGVGKKIGKAFGLLFVTLIKLPFKLITSGGNFVKKLFTKSFQGKDVKGALSKFNASIINGLSNAWTSIKNWGSSIGEKTKNAWENIKNFGGDVWEGIKESELMNFISSLFNSLKEGITKFFNENPVGKWMDSYIMSPIKNAFAQMGVWFSYIGDAFSKGGISNALSAMTVGMFKKDKESGLTEYEIYKQSYLNPTESVNDAIIKTDGSVIKTNPKDTLVALKDVPLSMDKVREDANKNINSSINGLENNVSLENKLSTIIDVLSRILEKDIQIQLPPQTRNDLDMLMSGGMI